MKNFSKKNEIILFSAAILLLLIGSAVTLFTEQILVSFPTFLEEHVFHRTFFARLFFLFQHTLFFTNLK